MSYLPTSLALILLILLPTIAIAAPVQALTQSRVGIPIARQVRALRELSIGSQLPAEVSTRVYDISVNVGEIGQVRLDTNPSTGCEWWVESAPNVVDISVSSDINPAIDCGTPPRPGCSNQVAVYSFSSNAAGHYTIELRYGHPWAHNEYYEVALVNLTVINNVTTVCSEGAVQVLETCPDGTTWKHRQVCRNNAWVDENQHCPTPSGPNTVVRGNVVSEPLCDENGKCWIKLYVIEVLLAAYPNCQFSVGNTITVETKSGLPCVDWPIHQGDAVEVAGIAYSCQSSLDVIRCEDGHYIRKTPGPSCPEGAVNVLEMCPDGSTWEHRQVCRSNAWVDEYQNCPSCPDGQSWTGSQCACPSGQQWNGQQCETPCPDGQFWDGSRCSCPYGQEWNGQQCVPSVVCSEGDVRNAVTCPDGVNWKQREVCRNNNWVPESQTCPVQQLSIAGGRPEYQGARPVFFRGSNVRVSVSVTGEPVTYTLWSAESEDVLKAGDYTGPWTAISTVTSSEQIFDFPIPSSAPIGAYRISSGWGKSDVFYVIFDPGLDHGLPTRFWKESTVLVVYNFMAPPSETRTRHFEQPVLEWSLSLAFGAESPESAIHLFNTRLRPGLINSEGPVAWPPKDIYDDVVSKWGDPPTFPSSPVVGDCDWISATEAALARSIGIPSTVIAGLTSTLDSHMWAEHFVFDDGWKIIVSESTNLKGSELGQPGSARYLMSGELLRSLHASKWLDVCNAEHLSLSAEGQWGEYPNLIEQGYGYGASGTTVTLEETGHKLYLHIYDSEGRHVGFDYETKSPEVNIPGAAYCDSDTTTMVSLPLEPTAFRYVVDAKYATSENESYNVTLSELREGLAASEITQQGTIRQGDKHDHEVEVANDGKEILVDRPWWDRYQPWLMYSVIALIAGGLLAAYAIRRRTTSPRQAGPRVKEIRSITGRPRVKSIQETGTKPRVLKIEEE